MLSGTEIRFKYRLSHSCFGKQPNLEYPGKIKLFSGCESMRIMPYLLHYCCTRTFYADSSSPIKTMEILMKGTPKKTMTKTFHIEST